MASTKITVTIPDSQIQEIRARVAARQSSSVSGFVQRAIDDSLQNAAEFRHIVDQALTQTGGPVTPKERAWARKLLATRKASTPRKAS